MRALLLLAVAVVLAACGSGSGGTITVRGKLVDRFGTGTSGATMVLGNRSTTTDSSGAFTFSDVTPPYDLTQVILGEVPTQFAVVYSGLTRADPTLPDRRRTATLYSASVTGNLTGPDPLGGPDRWTAVAWGSPGVTAQSAAGPVPYNLEVDWTGPGSVSGTIHALQWLSPTEFPVTYTMYGQVSGTLDAGSHPTLDVALSPVDTASVSGTAAIPDAGYTAGQVTMDLVFDDGATISVGSPSFAGGAFSLPVPALSNARAKLTFAFGNGGIGTITTFQGITPGTSAVTVPFQTPQTLLSPPDLATGVDTSTEFSWTPSDQGITLFILAGGQTEIVVFTGRTTAHLPDLSAYGVTLPATTPITWAAWSIGPWSSVDALAGSGAIFPVVPISFETHSEVRHLSLR